MTADIVEGGDLEDLLDAGANRPVMAYLVVSRRAVELGMDWVSFSLFEADWPAVDLPFWTLRAYAAAREQP